VGSGFSRPPEAPWVVRPRSLHGLQTPALGPLDEAWPAVIRLPLETCLNPDQSAPRASRPSVVPPSSTLRATRAISQFLQ